MEMDNYKRGLYGFPRDLHQDYQQYLKGKNVRELTQGTGASGGGGGGDIILVFFAWLVILAVIPYAIISLVSGAFIYLSLRKRFFLTYWNTYLATFYSTLALNIFLVLNLFIFCKCLEFFEPAQLSGFIVPFLLVIIGLVGAIYGTAAVFHRAIKKRIKYSISIRYTLFLLIPINIFFHLLPLICFAIFFLYKFNIPIPSIGDIKQFLINL